MQTFLPEPDFTASAAALDDRRLGKQRVETFQILRALVWPAYGWKNHPAVGMWRGFTRALVAYGLAACAEWRRRGHRDTVAGALLEFTGGAVPDPLALLAQGELPPWLGDRGLHLSHRAALVRKDPGCYAGRWPGVDPRLAYVWPEPAFPRWPIHRPTPEPVPLADALALLGLVAAPADLPTSAMPPPVETPDRAAALVAALRHPAPTAWRVATPAPVVTPGPELTGPAVAAPSATARSAGPAETLATKAEADAVPWVRFLREHQPLPEPAGLVVVERPTGFLLFPSEEPPGEIRPSGNALRRPPGPGWTTGSPVRGRR